MQCLVFLEKCVLFHDNPQCIKSSSSARKYYTPVSLQERALQVGKFLDN